MRPLVLLMLVSCGGEQPDPTATDDPIDPYAGIEASDAIVPLGVLPGQRVVHLMDLATDGQSVWAAAYAGGLSVDVSDPAAPALRGSAQGRRLYGVDYSASNILFSGRESGVALMERATDGALSRLGRRQDEAEASERAVLVGEHVAIAAQTGGLIFARQPDLREVSRMVTECPNAFAVTAVGDRVYVGDRERGLVIIDASDPADPQELGSIALRSAAQDLTVLDGVVWVAAGGVVQGVDVSDPAAPVIVATLTTGGVATRVDGSGSVLAVAAWSDTRIYDVSTPDKPVLIAVEDATSSATSVAIHDDLLVVGDWDDLRTYRIDTQARSAQLRADSYLTVVGEGDLSTRLIVKNDGNLPLELTALTCGGSGVTPEFEPFALLPDDVGEVSLAVAAGDGSAFEVTCQLASSDFDQPSHAFVVRVNPAGLSVGDVAPDFTMADLDGAFHSLSDTRGSVVMISIFSSL